MPQGSTLRNGRLHGKGKGDGVKGLFLLMLEVVRMSSLLLVPLGINILNLRTWMQRMEDVTTTNL
jgi:hypothetical protein